MNRRYGVIWLIVAIIGSMVVLGCTQGAGPSPTPAPSPTTPPETPTISPSPSPTPSETPPEEPPIPTVPDENDENAPELPF
jgi:hypothetical protein